MIRECIPLLLENHELTPDQAKATMKEIMSGEATSSQVAAFLIGLKKKRETADEVTALAQVMREFSRRIHPKINGYLLDTCGTGGDRTKTFNVSTTAAFVIAAAGVPVAKHGNRSFTSKCGSADLLEQLGLNLNMEAELVERAIEEIGIGFMFAPNFHPAMKNVASIRREIGVRTVFNILGPLTNPAGANAQLIGVYDSELLEPICLAAHNLGAKSVMTVYGLDGVDEISMTGKTIIVRRQDGRLFRDEMNPEDLGFKRSTSEEVSGSVPEENARLTAKILSGQLRRDDPRVQMVLANAAAGLVLCERAENFREGVEIAFKVVSDGKPLRTLHQLVEFSGGDTQRLKNMA
ncbi:MAG: anthranilate phosphoribosyltransferase [Crenarchaeota archaeon 13_1_40CM_3_52_17]|nr:MAG: anthranilate phosphoribosyltransferase [Crenarchaeota archaeon 13_1_40CM_3_52_17]